MNKLFTYNLFARIIFLILTPLLFRMVNFAFIWHSIYWGVITWVVVIWGGFVILSPLIGRVGCGWFCFFGTLNDIVSQHPLYKIPWNNPKWWSRILGVIAFFITSLLFFFINLYSGVISQIHINLWFFDMDFNEHYKFIWLYDCIGAVLFGFFLDKRWICRNLCFMGCVCAAGATFSRLIPVVDTDKCTLCRKCEKDCLVKIPITTYVVKNSGLVTNSECLICGKCIESCYRKAISLKFVWNRKRYKQNKLAGTITYKLYST
jgi:ferredoxin-type protein NapH